MIEEALQRWAFRLLGLAGAAVLIVAGLTFVLVRKLSNPRVEALTPEESEDDPRAAIAGASHAWAQRNGFTFLGFFVEGGTGGFIGAWRLLNRPTFFCHYVVREANKLRSAFDFVTLFENEVMLTTGGTADGQLFPRRPTDYLQTFSDISLDDQCEWHQRMEEYLATDGGARMLRGNISLQDAITDAIRTQMAHVRSLPFWPLRGLYWFFIRRKLWHNRSIRTLREAERIRLPNETA